MPTLYRGRKDSVLEKIAAALAAYERDHPGAQTSYYRQNSTSVRIRVIDAEFSELSKADRGRIVWPYLRGLAEKVQGDITVLLLLSPDEAEKSLGNHDFENPRPSRL